MEELAELLERLLQFTQKVQPTPAEWREWGNEIRLQCERIAYSIEKEGNR